MASITSSAVGYLRRLWEHRDLALYLALGRIRASNAATALGLAWWILNPMLLAGVYFLVFGVIFPGARGGPEYLAYLLSGIFPFYFTTRCLIGGAASVTSNSRLVSNLRFPRIILPISILIEASIGFAASMLVYFAVAGPLAGYWPGVHTILLIPAFLLHAAFNLGIGALLARVAVFYRDTGNLLPYITRIWLYVSPVIWTPDRIENAPDWLSPALAANPMAAILELYRAALMGSELRQVSVVVATATAVGVGAAGVAIFIKGESRMTRYL